MFMTKLDVVNTCLRTMGETKLNTLEEDHSYKGDALSILDEVLGDTAARSLWYNTEWVDLRPQATSGYIMLPEDFLRVYPETKCRRHRVAARGRRLYNVGRNSYVFDHGVTVKAARAIPFEDCPYEVQMFVRDETALRFQTDFDGDNHKYEKLMQQRNRSQVALNSEHIRQVKANPLHSHVGGMLRTVVGVPHPHRTY